MTKIILPDGMLVSEVFDVERLTEQELLAIGECFDNIIFAPNLEGVLVPYESTDEADYFLDK